MHHDMDFTFCQLKLKHEMIIIIQYNSVMMQKISGKQTQLQYRKHTFNGLSTPAKINKATRLTANRQTCTRTKETATPGATAHAGFFTFKLKDSSHFISVWKFACVCRCFACRHRCDEAHGGSVCASFTHIGVVLKH